MKRWLCLLPQAGNVRRNLNQPLQGGNAKRTLCRLPRDGSVKLPLCLPLQAGNVRPPRLPLLRDGSAKLVPSPAPRGGNAKPLPNPLLRDGNEVLNNIRKKQGRLNPYQRILFEVEIPFLFAFFPNPLATLDIIQPKQRSRIQVIPFMPSRCTHTGFYTYLLSLLWVCTNHHDDTHLSQFLSSFTMFLNCLSRTTYLL